MNKTQLFHHLQQGLQMMFMVLLMTAMGCSLTACSDDDDNGGSSQDAIDDKTAFENVEMYNILNALQATYGSDNKTIGDDNDLPSDWRNQAFTAGVGYTTDEANPMVRTMAVSGEEEAKMFYSSLTGGNLYNGVTDYTYTSEGVGTINFKLVNDGQTVATIDFNIPQLKLTRLNLVLPGNMGTNATFEGWPYYHIGDVVKDKKDGNYWVCVRSAYSRADKDKTYWASFSLPDRHKETYEADNNHEKIVVYDKLSSELRMYQYLAQLLKVLDNPQTYADGVVGSNGVFKNGLGELGVNAHPVDTVEQIAYWWEKENLWSVVLPNSISRSRISSMDGMNFFYKKSSRSRLKKRMTLPVASFSGTGMSTANTNDDWGFQMQNNVTFDINYFLWFGNNQGENIPQPTGGAFVVRIKTGKELVNGWKNPDPTKALDTAYVKPVYTYRERHALGDVARHDGPLPGDVFKDQETGKKWFCIEGYNDPSTPENRALLVSFDAWKEGSDHRSITNAPNEEDIPHIFYLLYKIAFEEDKTYNYIDIPFKDDFVQRDSIYIVHTKDGVDLESPSRSPCCSFFYKSKTDGSCQLMRLVIDKTHVGYSSIVDAEENRHIYYRFFKHYLADDKAEIKYGDEADPDKVKRYAIDKWTLCQLSTQEGAFIPYRWSAESYVRDISALGRHYYSSMFWDHIWIFTAMRTDKIPESFKTISRNPDEGFAKKPYKERWGYYDACKANLFYMDEEVFMPSDYYDYTK